MFLKMPEPVAVNINNTLSPFPADQSSLINVHDVYRVFIGHILLSSQARTINTLKQDHLLIKQLINKSACLEALRIFQIEILTSSVLRILTVLSVFL